MKSDAVRPRRPSVSVVHPALLAPAPSTNTCVHSSFSSAPSLHLLGVSLQCTPVPVGVPTHRHADCSPSPLRRLLSRTCKGAVCACPYHTPSHPSCPQVDVVLTLLHNGGSGAVDALVVVRPQPDDGQGSPSALWTGSKTRRLPSIQVLSCLRALFVLLCHVCPRCC